MFAGGDLLVQVYGALDPITQVVIVFFVSGLFLSIVALTAFSIVGSLARSQR
jgi:hypothetical protein